MSSRDKLLIAAAGAGKTTYLVNKSLENKDKSILITTYTQANAEGIRNKFIELNSCIPRHVTVQTWFSFLIQHGVKPFQTYFDERLFEFQVNGLLLVNEPSGVKNPDKSPWPIYYKEEELLQHYFTSGGKIYSDKLSKFVVGGGEKLRKSRKKFSELTINRLSRIYTDIYVDEMQDLAGYDLEFLKILFKSSIDVLLVGDPRQVTYLTHHERKYGEYRDGRIIDFMKNKCGKEFGANNIDENTLKYSHRNNVLICKFSSKLYPEYPESQPCRCPKCRETDNLPHHGIFLVKRQDIHAYLSKYSAMQLRHNLLVKVNNNFSVKNFGDSKGLTYERVLIYPTRPFLNWLKNGNKLEPTSRAKFYVALTRARFSVGIVCDDDLIIEGVNIWNDTES